MADPIRINMVLHGCIAEMEWLGRFSYAAITLALGHDPA